MEAAISTTKLRLTLIQVKLTKVGENPLGGNAIMSAVFDWVITDTVMKIHLNTVTKYALWKWGHFERAKPILKMLPTSHTSITYI